MKIRLVETKETELKSDFLLSNKIDGVDQPSTPHVGPKLSRTRVEGDDNLHGLLSGRSQGSSNGPAWVQLDFSKKRCRQMH